MNIRKEYPKVCLFLWILGMCFHAHPILAQSVIPVPLKMEQGTGSFLLSEKTKLYTNLQGGEAELWENYLKALPVQLKEARMKDRKQMLFLLITPRPPNCHHRKAIHSPSPLNESRSGQLREPDYSMECKPCYS